MKLDTKQMHKDINKKLKKSMLPQRHLTEELGIGRATFWRLSKGHEMQVSTFLKLITWLDKDLNYYIKKEEHEIIEGPRFSRSF